MNGHEAEAIQHAGDAVHNAEALYTLGLSIVAGVFLVLLSRKLRMSAIVLLLLGGIALGPQLLGWVNPSALGSTLTPLIAIAVGLILFEGGLTLNVEGYKSASGVIRRLLTLGVLTTWFVTSGLIYLLFGDLFPERPYAMSLLAASLVIVTGPTVIAPLLRRIRIRKNLHDILHWEGVLIDPIGVFIAILTFEYITGGGAEQALGGFMQRVVAGLVVGSLAGLGCDYLIRKRWIPDDNLNIFIIAVAVMVYVVDDYLVEESGLLGVTVAGLVLGYRRPGALKQIQEFKAEISDLLIGALFIVLAAQLKFEDFQRFGMKGLLLVLAVVFFVRPLSIFFCTLASPLSLKERIFLSYVAPRGIVAASMAALFALRLSETTPSSWFFFAFTFSVIGFTVILQGSTAGLFAHLLGLKLPQPTGWMIVGAHPFARRVAAFLKDRAKVDCLLIDSNRRAIQEARSEGFMALNSDARDPSVLERIEFRSVGNVLALTDNEELNVLICQRWLTIVGREHVFRWGSGNPTSSESHEQPGSVVWKGLPKPSLVASELVRHETHLLITEASKAPEQLGQALMFIRQDASIVLEPQNPPKDEKGEMQGSYLFLKRHAEYLQRSLRPALVVQLKDVENKEQLFEELVQRVTGIEPRLDKAAILEELLEREKSFPTALGHGVAVPHAYAKGLTQRMCAIAQVPHGIPFDAIDNEPVKLVFLLISPQGDPEGHLATMGEIARLVSDEEARRRMAAAPDAADIMAIVETARK